MAASRGYLSCLALLLFAFFSSLAFAAQSERTIDVLAWPLSASAPQTLASISYNSTHANLKRYTAPKVPANDDIVRVGFNHPSGSWSGVATTASNFAFEMEKKILLHLNTAGDLYHVGFRASKMASSGTGPESSRDADGVSVEIVRTLQGAAPVLNKPVVLNPQGEVNKPEVEKNFFQKYWWVIAGVLVLQMVMGGGGKE